MPSIREMRLRIRSIKNLAQVTRALETVSASKVRRAIQANEQTRPYAKKAWEVLVHLSRQPGRKSLHPLLADREEAKKDLVVLVTSDRGLAGAYNVNIVRHTLIAMREHDVPAVFVTVGRKGRDMLIRRRRPVIAEFSGLPVNPSFSVCAPIGKLVVDEYLKGNVDEVFIAYTEFISMLKQEPVIRRLLPLKPEEEEATIQQIRSASISTRVFSYEPGAEELLDEIIPRFTALQIYQAILSAQASEHAARMVAMRNATDSAKELVGVLQIEYNKARQASITNDILDITGGAEALAQAMAERE
ncbi:MAG: ATP synthase F1 subunit gamma [Chloroflexota bacterium]